MEKHTDSMENPARQAAKHLPSKLPSTFAMRCLDYQPSTHSIQRRSVACLVFAQFLLSFAQLCQDLCQFSGLDWLGGLGQVIAGNRQSYERVTRKLQSCFRVRSNGVPCCEKNLKNTPDQCKLTLLFLCTLFINLRYFLRKILVCVPKSKFRESRFRGFLHYRSISST